jgi:hypothetical protein
MRILDRFRLKRRAMDHARRYPEDTLVVQSVLDAIDGRASNAREAAELALGRKLEDADWSAMCQRWERPWDAINKPFRE